MHGASSSIADTVHWLNRCDKRFRGEKMAANGQRYWRGFAEMPHHYRLGRKITPSDTNLERRREPMRFGILGTGVVGRTLAGRLDGLGHEVMVGTRDPEATMSRTEPDQYGNPPFIAWQQEHPRVLLGG